MRVLICVAYFLTMVSSLDLRMKETQMVNMTVYVLSPVKGQELIPKDYYCNETTCIDGQVTCWKCNTGTHDAMNLIMYNNDSEAMMNVQVGDNIKDPDLMFSIIGNDNVMSVSTTQYGENKPIYFANTYTRSVVDNHYCMIQIVPRKKYKITVG